MDHWWTDQILIEDGQATDWRVQRDPDVPSLLGLGSYGLHVLHSTNKTDQSITSWKLKKVYKKTVFLFLRKVQLGKLVTFLSLLKAWKVYIYSDKNIVATSSLKMGKQFTE